MGNVAASSANYDASLDAEVDAALGAVQPAVSSASPNTAIPPMLSVLALLEMDSFTEHAA